MHNTMSHFFECDSKKYLKPLDDLNKKQMVALFYVYSSIFAPKHFWVEIHKFRSCMDGLAEKKVLKSVDRSEQNTDGRTLLGMKLSFRFSSQTSLGINSQALKLHG
ncbi:hypothetical protein CEXT_290491 [Caerostris extrusa]|uniref:Uncharacterized protein n=1 Tax=Caerostris extrusa TaxID=172846 RepID=A0AAV4UUQ1_CAEEX|nr:hypothetical protein CEXT_290491 [Caerostris extrusa]